MKSGLLILLGALFLSGVGYFSSHLLGHRDAVDCTACAATSLKPSEALAWMRHDFALSDDEFARVCALHASYLPRCDAMCQRMAAATAHVSSALQSNPAMTAEARAALHEYEVARDECERDTLQHVLDTAAVMKPEAGRSFVQKVVPHLLVSRHHVSELQH